MMGLFGEKIECPSCKTKISSTKVRVSRHRTIKVFNCPHCNADFVKNKRAQLFPVLEEGVILC
jgi:transposase-like protein